MSSNVVGLFDTTEQAQMAIRRLMADGIRSQDISLVLSDTAGKIHTEKLDESGDMAGAGAMTGAASGMIVGGLIGLLAGAVTLAAPPVGFVVAGPIVGLFTGMTLGMASGGLLGALIGLGLPEEEAHVYAESVRRGSILVVVQVDTTNRQLVEQVLAMAGAVNIVERAGLYRQSGFTQFDPNAPVYSPDEALAERQRLKTVAPLLTDSSSYPIGEELYIPDDLFMDDYWSNFAQTGLTYAEVRDAYRFGYDLATRPEFRDLSWDQAVTEARSLWDQSHVGTWEKYRGAIHTGWAKAGVRATSGASLI